jgi:integrase
MQQHQNVLSWMQYWFGEHRQADGITPQEAREWIEAIYAGKLAHLRKWKMRGDTDKPPSETTVRKMIRDVQTIYNWAEKRGVVSTNPFSELNGQAPQPEPNAYISAQAVEAVCEQCTSESLAMLFRLCRYAGLRRGEAMTLPWSGKHQDGQGRVRWVGVDWQRRRLCLVAPKTGRYRETPICPELFSPLAWLAWNPEPPADDPRIVKCAANNVLRRAKRAILWAGYCPWPKPFQALRSSCENDWKKLGIAEATYCQWLGHHPVVSRMNYVAAIDDEFAAITGQTPDAGPG